MAKYTFKLYLFLTVVLLDFNIVAEGQYLISSTQKITYENDSVILHIDTVRGEIQWQASKDKMLWQNIAGEMNDSLFIHVDSSAFYRAMITEGTCAPVYSDTVLIAQVYDDRDSQFYDAVRIGAQWWLAENLKFYSPSGSWFYEDDSMTNSELGRLYNWHIAKSACPSGWHLPSDDEWKVLELELGMSKEEADKIEWRGTEEGTKLKITGSSGFNALFAGYRDENGVYRQLSSVAAFWTQSEESPLSAWYRGLGGDSMIYRYDYDKEMAFSVRCVKSQPPALLTNQPVTIATKSAIFSALLIHDGGSEVIEKGFCWDTSPFPTINHNYVKDTTLITEESAYSSLVDVLQINTTYYVRAYAKNEYGTGYGNEISFITRTFSAPVVRTTLITNIGMTSARVGGEITDSGEREITGKGICWSISPDPTIQGNHTTSGTGPDAFSAQITGLNPNTIYYVRAYAINNIGISYGENKTLVSLPVNPTDSITDSRDGHEYKTINIGGQWWMAENLNYQTAGTWCYENNNANCSDYGRLYSWNAAKSACPSGWHLPADAEWKEMEMNLGMSLEEADAIDNRGTDEGIQLKDKGSSGFDVLFGGIRNEDGTFAFLGTGGAFWTSSEYNATQAWYRGFSDNESRIHRYYFDKDMGFSVRCVRDELPVVTTSLVDSIGKTYARSGGEVIKDGGFAITQRGVCWGTASSPTIADNHTNDGSGTGKYISILTGLTQNTTYYVRAYAKNSIGTAYGEEKSFITITLPNVTTASISSITTNSAVGGGNVTDDGGITLLARGVCWSISPEPTITSSHTTQAGNTGSFTSNLTGLAPNTVYYVRAYASNVMGTVYGNQRTFETPPLNPTNTVTDSRDGKVYKTIDIGGLRWMAENLNYQMTGSWCYENNNTNCSDYGRLYSWSAAKSACLSGWHLASDAEWKTLEMSLGMSQEEADAIDHRGTDEGTQLKDNGSSGFDVLFGGVRNEDGTYAYLETGGAFWTSSEYNTSQAWYRGFSDAEARIHRYYYAKGMGFSVRCVRNELPVVITSDIISYTDSSVYGGGNVTYDGGLTVTARGICIGTSHDPTISDDTTNNGTGMGEFTSYKKGLNPATTYYVRAYAKNSKGTSYGTEKSFITDIGIPKVTTSTVTSITDSSARCGGNVTSTGGATVTARGVCYGTSPNPVIEVNDKTNNGTGTGSYVSVMNNLQPNTTYYVRAYATNSAGTGYGVQRTFKTQKGLPKVTTSSITAITETTATGGGNVTSDGGATVTARGICWSLSQNPDIFDSKTTNGSGTGSFVSSMTSLQPNKTYYVRAYATNSEGTGYGNQVSFVTSTALPQVTTGTISSITSTTASGGGNVTSDGGSPIKARGVCWSKGISPTIADSKTTNGTGTGIFTSSLTGLTRNTKYYVRAYATNNADLTGYGDTVSFRTLAELPQLSTTDVSSLTHNSASTGGTITNDGGASIISKGVCWNTSGSPTVSDSKTNDGTGTAAYTSLINGLDAYTTYYVRAYAQNSAGYNYGNQLEFKTLHETITDARDNQIYKIIKIGSDWWMAENLNYTYTGSVYYYNDSITHAEIYGRLYTWTSMMKGAATSNTVPSNVQGVCPSGWHIPSNAEWNSLITDLGGSGLAGGALKETGTDHWENPNTGATNESGFTARPAGLVDSGLSSNEEGSSAYFWTTTESDASNANAKKLSKNNDNATNVTQPKTDHCSVRCKKN